MSQTLKQHREIQHNFHSLIKYVTSASFAPKHCEGGGATMVNMSSVSREFRLKEEPRHTYVHHLGSQLRHSVVQDYTVWPRL